MKEPISKRKKHFYSFGDFRLYVAERELFRDAEPVDLPPKALDTLLVLVSRRGHVVDRDELMKTLWPDTFVEEANLVQQISHLRKALGEKPDRGAVYRDHCEAGLSLFGWGDGLLGGGTNGAEKR